MSKLYVVPTPVGNLEDMTFRAINVLREVDCILAEDTRTSGILLKHYDIRTRMQSHHKFNEHQTVEGIVTRIEGGETIALISDAGTPAISDPGFLLVRECRRRGIPVECLPGATAFVPALVASGLPNEKFCFEGFLPQTRHPAGPTGRRAAHHHLLRIALPPAQNAGPVQRDLRRRPRRLGEPRNLQDSRGDGARHPRRTHCPLYRT